MRMFNYYDPASTRDRAARLRDRVAEAFPKATLGRWHDERVGPHPRSMYQIAFPRALLASFLPWLMLNRDGLTILVHPETGDDLADHTDHWRDFAIALAQFLVALQRIDSAGGLPPGQHNFFRGGPLTIYDAETRQAIKPSISSFTFLLTG